MIRREFDATILAAAGLDRLDLPGIGSVELDLETMLPAPGQGALAVESRRSDERITEIVSALDHADSRAAVTAERSLLRHLSGGCLAPIGAYAMIVDERLVLSAVVLSVDGQVRLHHAGVGKPQDAKALGEEIADALLAAGADRWIAERDKQRPFFLYIPWNAPHSPLQAPEDLLAGYANVTDPKRKTYLAMVESMDRGIGRVLMRLEKDGLAENTIVITPPIRVFISANMVGLTKGLCTNSRCACLL